MGINQNIADAEKTRWTLLIALSYFQVPSRDGSEGLFLAGQIGTFERAAHAAPFRVRRTSRGVPPRFPNIYVLSN